MNDRLPKLDERQCAMLAEMGVPVWWQSTVAGTEVPAVPAIPAARPATVPSVRPPTPVPAVTQASPRPDTVLEPAPGADVSSLGWETLESAIRACRQCDLCQRRQQAVPGMGDRAPEWLIVGEAPGEEEDRQGLPFVGRAGQLLDRMLAAMDLSREQNVYIANVIKCRPPHNRNPDPAEIAQCTPYLLRQVQLLQPKVILAMGRFAAHTLLAQGGRFDAGALQQMPLGKLRGQVHEVTLAGLTLPVVVTYHPAYLLRSPAEKAKAWADLCLAMDTMDRVRSQL
jgi:DNA polymerase